MDLLFHRSSRVGSNSVQLKFSRFSWKLIGSNGELRRRGGTRSPLRAAQSSLLGASKPIANPSKGSRRDPRAAQPPPPCSSVVSPILLPVRLFRKVSLHLWVSFDMFHKVCFFLLLFVQLHFVPFASSARRSSSLQKKKKSGRCFCCRRE